MAYTPTIWINDQAPALSATNLNKLTDELEAQAAAISLPHTLPTWADGTAPALTEADPLNEMERVAAAVAAYYGMSYAPTTWSTGWTPARNALRLNRLEQQVASNSVGLPPTACTKVLAPGESLQFLLDSLVPGDVACIRAGSYTAGQSYTISASDVTVRGYGDGETIIRSELVLNGSRITLRDFTIDLAEWVDPDPGATTSGVSGVRVVGSGNRIEHLEIRNCARHGIITATASSNTTIVRNYIHDVGTEASHEHGIYMQTSGLIACNLIVRPKAYGISLYSSPSNVSVIQNTITGASPVEAAISVNSTGTGIVVANNILAFNQGYGINAARGGALVDRNLIYGNPSGAVRGSGVPVTNTIAADPKFADALYRLAIDSPAIGAARPDYVYSPDRDGVSRPQGAASDLGAYER